MARSPWRFGRGPKRWSARAVVLASATLVLSGTATAQVSQPAPSGPDPIVLVGVAGVGAFLGALVANLAWKALASDEDDAATPPPQGNPGPGPQAPPASGGAQQPPAGGAGGGHQPAGGSPQSGNRGGQGGTERGR